MNNYKFEDLKIGIIEKFSVTITDEMMDSFLKLSGDTNPLHIENGFAKKQGFDDRVVYGLLSSAMISKLVGVYLPGKYCLLKSIELKYLHPVYINDRLEVRGEIIAINYTVRQIEIDVKVINQNGKKVIKGKLKTGLLPSQEED